MGSHSSSLLWLCFPLNTCVPFSFLTTTTTTTYSHSLTMASPMMLMALEDLTLLLQVLTCVLAGWCFETLFLPFHFLSGAEVHEKTVEENKMSVESDSDNEAGYKEVFTPQEDVPPGLHILEQYGVFGASPGAWTSKVAHSEADSTGCKEVFTPQDGLQLLEQYGILG